MIKNPKTKEELLKELATLQLENESLKAKTEKDISLSQKVDKKPNYKQYLLYALMNNMPIHIYFKDCESRFIMVDKGSAQSFGLNEPEQAVGKTDFDFFTHEHAQQAYEDEQEIIRTGQPISKEEKETWADRPNTWVSTSKMPLYDKNKKIIGTFGISVNITERKRAEGMLRESEDRYRDLVENSNDLICTHDLDGNILSINNAALKISGYSKEEALKMNMQNIIVPEYRKIFDAYLAKIKTLGYANGLMIVQTKTGERRIWEYNNSVRTDGISEPIVRGMVKDVTRLKSTEANLKKLNAELIKNIAEKDKFFSIIAHDLRSPFQSFINLTKIIADETDSFSSEEVSQLGKEMNKSATNLFTLLQNLFEWANMQKGSMNIHPEELSLSELISANMELLNMRGRQKGVKVINMVTTPVYVYADKNMINSVIINLLSNAVKFTKRNGSVEINAKKNDNEMTEISVSDTGVGIPNDIMNKLFRVGEKTNRAGTEGELSTGLGLLLCKEFVEKHGGKIWAESEEGVGSTFYFTLRSHQ